VPKSLGICFKKSHLVKVGAFAEPTCKLKYANSIPESFNYF